MSDFFHNAAAMRPMIEPVMWRQDKAPHRKGAFGAVVLHGESQSETAGASRGGFAADPWTVIVPATSALCADVAVGDTLTRLGVDGETLTVQQITRDDTGWTLRCTSEERAPR